MGGTSIEARIGPDQAKMNMPPTKDEEKKPQQLPERDEKGRTNIPPPHSTLA